MLKKLIYTAVLGLALAACSEDAMDRINADHSHPQPDAVNARFQITDATVSTAFTSWGGAYAWYVSSFTEQTFGTGNSQLMMAELRQRTETAASTTFNNQWNNTYANLLNISQILAKCKDGGTNAGQPDIEGIGQTLWVLNAELLTDLHGDIPYSEALVSRQPRLDRQEDIYKDLLTRINDAEAKLRMAVEDGVNNCGTQDVLYGGDPAKWLALAYAVEARLHLNTTFRDNSAYAKAVTAAEAALAAGFGGADLSVFNGSDCKNSWTAYFRSRYYTGANGTVVGLFADRRDPRLEVYAVDYFGTGITYADAGDETMAKTTNTVGIPLWLDNGAAKLHIFSVAELRFILAESKARTGGGPKDDFEAGIRASFADYAEATGTTIAGVDDYIASLGAPTLKEIMIQKYLAQARDEQLQTYNDLRRYKAFKDEYLTLKNPCNVSEGQNQWPLRLAYGNSDVVSNPNVTAAFGSGNDAGNYIFTENVWLFGGSR